MSESANVLAVQRAYAENGRDAAISEIRRRWPNISDAVLDATLERILLADVEPPARLSHSSPLRDSTRGRKSTDGQK